VQLNIVPSRAIAKRIIFLKKGPCRHKVEHNLYLYLSRGLNCMSKFAKLKLKQVKVTNLDHET